MKCDFFEDVNVRVTDGDVVCVPVEEYAELVRKADRLEMLAADIRRRIGNGEHGYGVIDCDVVRVLTGTAECRKQPPKPAREEDDGK